MEEMEMNVTPEQPKKKFKIWQIVVASVACLVLLLSLTVVMWWSIAGVDSWDEGVQLVVKLFTPRENNVYRKDSYTVSAGKAFQNKDKVIATVGGNQLTNGQLQIYYWVNIYDYLENYGYYAIYNGLDYTKPLDQQTCPEMKDGTWQQYFLEDALMTWHKYQALALEAQEKGIKLPEDLRQTLDNLRATMSETALKNGFSSLDGLIQSDMGPGCTFEDYQAYMEVYCAGYSYFNDIYTAIEITKERMEEYFTAHEEELKTAGITKDSGKQYDVRHILIEIEGGTKNTDGTTTYTDAEWEACRVKAQQLLDQWLAGEHTEESFAKLAQEHSADTGSSTNGGLYSGLDKNTNFVQSFKDWYLDETREKGHYGLVKSEYGYHIMYFSGAEEKWETRCRNGILTEEAEKILTGVVEKYPMEVTYKDIVLGAVDLSN